MSGAEALLERQRRVIKRQRKLLIQAHDVLIEWSHPAAARTSESIRRFLGWPKRLARKEKPYVPAS